MVGASQKMLVALVLIFATLASAFNVSLFRTPCKTDSDCVTSVCLTNGTNVNGDSQYYYCQEPASCDPSIPARVDGVCNNLNAGRRLRGSIGHMQLRRINGTFSNSVPPRSVSDGVGSSPSSIPNKFGTSLLLAYFGQFVDHDITIVHEGEDTTAITGSGLVGDFTFHGSQKVGGPQQQPNVQNFITSWLDLSQVYGSDSATRDTLRKHTGGEMLQQFIHGNEYLPNNANMSSPIPMAMESLPGIFAAGDVRANEHVILISLHTLFLREHNRLAQAFAVASPSLTDEELYQKARRWNIAQYQNIVLSEFFPSWFNEPLPEYDGYDDTETPDIDIFFSTAAYRFGHSAIADVIPRVDELGNDYTMQLNEAFFVPLRVLENGGIDSLLKGASRFCHERIDTRVVNSLRNALFEDIPGTNGSMALDLLTLNIARGRDHQLPKYTDVRAYFGLSVPTTFDEVTGGLSCVTTALESLYGVDNVDQCDPIICALSEPAAHGHMGELMFAVQYDQFRRFRDADRFYFENQGPYGPGYTAYDIAEIKDTKLHHILRRNTFLHDDDQDVENFVEHAFKTDACCQSGGNVGYDTVCVADGLHGGAEWGMVDHCMAMSALTNEPVHMAGTENYDCSCNFVPPANCPYVEDGNLEVLLPPLLDETSTHVVFDSQLSSSAFEVTVKVPKQYRTAKFDFDMAAGNFGAYNSEFTNNTYWSIDKTSDPCNTIFTSKIPWNLLRGALGGMNENRYAAAVCYNTKINIEVTKELSLSPHTLLLDDLEQEYTRYVRTVIPFEVCFKTALKLWGSADVMSDHLRVAAAVVDTSVVNVTPDDSPLASAHLEFVTVIPLPLYLDAATINVSTPLLSSGLTISEIIAKRDCEPQSDFCTQFWEVHVEPEQCTLDGDFTAVVHGACHPGLTNCNDPDPAYDDIVMHISSDDFCGITQEIHIEGSLTLSATTCNDYMRGTVTVHNTEGFPISDTEIVEVHAHPTLLNSEFLTVLDSSLSILNYSYTLTAPDQVDFQFVWLGSELRCDVVASIDVVVKVEYEATAGVLLSAKSAPASSRVSLLSDEQDMHMSAQAQVFQSTAPSPTEDTNGQITPEAGDSQETSLFGLTTLQIVIAASSIALVCVLCMYCGVYYWRPRRKNQVYRPGNHTGVSQDDQYRAHNSGGL